MAKLNIPHRRIQSLPQAAQQQLFRNFEEISKVMRHAGTAGVVVVAADGTGDYSTLKAALDAIQSSGGYWIVYVRGATSETWGTFGGNYTYTSLNVCIVGEGVDSAVTINGTGSAIFTGGTDICFSGVTIRNGAGNLIFTSSNTYAVNSIFGATGSIQVDHPNFTNVALNAPTVTFPSDGNHTGGAITADTLALQGAQSTLSNILFGSFSGSTMAVTSDQSTYISGVLACYMTLGGAFGSYTFSFVDYDALGSGVTYRLTLAANRSTGIISASYGSSSRLIKVTGNKNRVMTGGDAVATDSGTGNSINGSGSLPGGSAGGDLSGTYPNPVLAAIGAGGTVGDATHVGVITWDSKGRVTAGSSVAISGGPPSGSAGGSLAGTYPNPTLAGRDTSVDAINKDLLPSALGGDPAGMAVIPVPTPGSAPTGAAAGSLAGTYPNPTLAGRDSSVDKINQDLLPALLGGDAGTTGMTTIPAPATGGGSPTGAAAGSLAGTYPNPTLAGRDSSVDKINQDLLPSLLGGDSGSVGMTTYGGVTSPAGAFLTSDAFTAADGTVMAGRSTDITFGGTAIPWANTPNATGLVKTNGLRWSVVTTTGLLPYEGDLLSVAPTLDVQVEATLIATSIVNNTGWGIVARATDKDNWYGLFHLRFGGVNYWYFIKNVAGGATALAAANYASPAPTANDVMKLTCIGNTISAYINGILLATVTDASWPSATKAGILAYQGNPPTDSAVTAGPVMDNFKVTIPTASVTTGQSLLPGILGGDPHGMASFPVPKTNNDLVPGILVGPVPGMGQVPTPAAGSAPTGAAAGSLAGTYPNPTFAGRDASIDKVNQDLLPALLGGDAGTAGMTAFPGPFAARDTSVDKILQDMLPSNLGTAPMGMMMQNPIQAMPYTPAWTAVTTPPALGNAVIVANFIKIGRLVEVWVRITFGSTSTFGAGNYSFSVPFPIDTTLNPAPCPIGDWMATISGVNQGGGVARVSSSTTFSLNAQPTGSVNPTTPGTFASGDSIGYHVSYLTTA